MSTNPTPTMLDSAATSASRVATTTVLTSFPVGFTSSIPAQVFQLQSAAPRGFQMAPVVAQEMKTTTQKTSFAPPIQMTSTSRRETAATIWSLTLKATLGDFHFPHTRLKVSQAKKWPFQHAQLTLQSVEPAKFSTSDLASSTASTTVPTSRSRNQAPTLMETKPTAP